MSVFILRKSLLSVHSVSMQVHDGTSLRNTLVDTTVKMPQPKYHTRLDL